jgi:hypothetical protein
MIIEVKGNAWAHIYIVFRGSRGDAADPEAVTEKNAGHNPKGAGWDSEWNKNVDWRANFDTRQVRFDSHNPKENVQVHNGFHRIYQSLRSELLAQLRKVCTPWHDIIVTGHSLGAALGTLCALDLNYMYPGRVTYLGFCCPRPGNRGFVKEFADQLVNTQAQTLLPDNESVSHAFWFDEKNDPVTSAQEYGHKPKEYKGKDASKRDQDSFFRDDPLNPFESLSPPPLAFGSKIPEMSTTSKAYDGWRTLTEDKSVEYYHVQNRVQISWFGMHAYTKMMDEIFGTSISSTQGLFVFTG